MYVCIRALRAKKSVDLSRTTHTELRACLLCFALLCFAYLYSHNSTTSDPYITPKPPQRRIFENFNLIFKY